MQVILSKLWKDDDGFIVSTELILVATILVLGLLAGLGTISAAVNAELGDIGAAIGVINQSFSYGGASGAHGITGGAIFIDQADGDPTNGGNCMQTCNGSYGLGGEQ